MKTFFLWLISLSIILVGAQIGKLTEVMGQHQPLNISALVEKIDKLEKIIEVQDMRLLESEKETRKDVLYYSYCQDLLDYDERQKLIDYYNNVIEIER